VALVLLATF